MSEYFDWCSCERSGNPLWGYSTWLSIHTLLYSWDYRNITGNGIQHVAYQKLQNRQVLRKWKHKHCSRLVTQTGDLQFWWNRTFGKEELHFISYVYQLVKKRQKSRILGLGKVESTVPAAKHSAADKKTNRTIWKIILVRHNLRLMLLSEWVEELVWLQMCKALLPSTFSRDMVHLWAVLLLGIHFNILFFIMCIANCSSLLYCNWPSWKRWDFVNWVTK